MRKTWIQSQEGFALPTVTLFLMVIGLSATSYYQVSSHETRMALHRQDKLESFYLAEGAVERARARFLENGSWRAGWDSESAGRGLYSLAIEDTTFQGQSGILRLLGSGLVESASAEVEIMAQIIPAAFRFGIYAAGDLTANGNLCLDGLSFAGGSADFGPNNVHLTCGGEVVEGVAITPPPVFTEGSYYPQDTYYEVRGTEIGGLPQARIFDRYGQDITTSLGDSLTSVTDFKSKNGLFEFEFRNSAEIDFYFNEDTGIFRREPGDQSVVVNFGSAPLLDPPGVLGIADLEFDGDPGTTLHATIINSRFTGSNDSQRMDSFYWTGGVITMKQVDMEPYNGLAFIARDFQKRAGNGALGNVGSESWPALGYVTGDVERVGANFHCVGEILCLGDWYSIGGPDITYDAGFLDFLPAYFRDDGIVAYSGSIEVLQWKEL
ncbi:MAG: pilus assembly PilX N-terminal domain-containing protein [Candidatus Krumholzibacteria bacterium]|jgi:hypothetical protein|nr:pilus assembly PilX N-terminal domain-containing protein [Candidatus Krumholzibacteria bacterium]MDP6797786.1 pilus assembly PilX N-terminal domain-containing protein [Candidatus Krumholzibacteria bacterium]MDP7021421.1 pilus assembly PilX N-terminal domain-containing protein [Candidatus Krumholzibacteria bacterium]